MSKEDASYANLSYSNEPVEITTQIRADQLLALELIQNAEQQKRGGPCDISELVQQALDMLIGTHLLAVKVPQPVCRIEE